MRITFLGTGGAFTDYRVNYQNNALIEVDGTRILVDCGVTACQSLRELGIHPTAIDAVAFTHLHADHASPEQLCWERMYTGVDGEPAGETTTLMGPEALIRPLLGALEPYMGIWRDLGGTTRTDGVSALVRTRTAPELECGPLSLRWFRVPHVDGGTISKAAYGIELQTARHRVLWSGDTTFSPTWVRAAAEDPTVHTIFHECSFSQPFHGTVHTHYEELLAIPRELRHKIVLMHHTAVPPDRDPRADGFQKAACRHDVFDLDTLSAG